MQLLFGIQLGVQHFTYCYRPTGSRRTGSRFLEFLRLITPGNTRHSICSKDRRQSS